MIDKKLKELRACEDARAWAQGKSWQEIYTTCKRGDWLLWLFAKVNPDNLRELTLAKAKCARTVFHLMKDERSRRAVIVAENFGRGVATRHELDAAAYAAYAADAARIKNQKQTADICRRYLPIKIWNIKDES
jgi:hypothetical protein